jgi:hypothetical protein
MGQAPFVDCLTIDLLWCRDAVGVICTEGVNASACGFEIAVGLSEIGAVAGVCVAGASFGASGIGVADATACGCNVAFRTASV